MVGFFVCVFRVYLCVNALLCVTRDTLCGVAQMHNLIICAHHT